MEKKKEVDKEREELEQNRLAIMHNNENASQIS